ncbi:hypothetical protein ACFE04_009107 [Oxalis oulophora]
MKLSMSFTSNGNEFSKTCLKSSYPSEKNEKNLIDDVMSTISSHLLQTTFLSTPSTLRRFSATPPRHHNISSSPNHFRINAKIREIFMPTLRSTMTEGKAEGDSGGRQCRRRSGDNAMEMAVVGEEGMEKEKGRGRSEKMAAVEFAGGSKKEEGAVDRRRRRGRVRGVCGG